MRYAYIPVEIPNYIHVRYAICMRYKSVQLPTDMVEQVKHAITSRRELGYVSVKGFVEDSVRRRLEEVQKP